MQENKKVKGLAIFSEEEKIKERSLKLYTYFVCHANLRNKPGPSGDNVRIFQHRDINLQGIKRTLGFDPETTKKYLEYLERSNLIRFCPHNWKEETIDEDGKAIDFKTRWKIRQKHKETYYEIPQPPLFRKVPKETLVELNEIFGVNELTMKIYIILMNYQEICNEQEEAYKKFTYQDIRDILGYKVHNEINKHIEASLFMLKGLGLIQLDKSEFINTYGVKIPCFILRQVNFYISYDFKGFETGDYSIISEDIKQQLVDRCKSDYADAFTPS